MEFYDVVIIGGGAAGLTSAIYSCRKSLKTLLIKGPHPGGETALTKNIENYPGYEKGSGSELMDSFERQAKKFGTEFIEDLVINVSKKSNKFLVKLESNKEFESKTVILAFGRKRRKLNIPGEDKFLGRGLSTCTICDAPLFAKKVVAVIGGGNSAVEGAVELSSIAKNHISFSDERLTDLNQSNKIGSWLFATFPQPTTYLFSTYQYEYYGNRPNCNYTLD